MGSIKRLVILLFVSLLMFPITVVCCVRSQVLAASEEDLTIEDGVVTHCDTSATGSLTIPDGVTSIGNGAFSGCTGLTSVSMRCGTGTLNEPGPSGRR